MAKATLGNGKGKLHRGSPAEEASAGGASNAMNRLPLAELKSHLWNCAEILRGMQAVMGTLPGGEKRCPLDMKVEEEVDCGTYVRRLITYASEPGARVPAYLSLT